MKNKFKIGDRVQLSKIGEENNKYILGDYRKIIISDVRQSSDMSISYECDVYMSNCTIDGYILQEQEIAEYKEEVPCRDTVGQPWIGVDLDGTLAKYDGWKGHDQIGDPIPRMVDKVKAKLVEGVVVKIFTARVCAAQEQNDRDTALRAITHWCFANLGVQLPVTCEKDFNLIELWDDRAVQIIPNSGMSVTEVMMQTLEAVE